MKQSKIRLFTSLVRGLLRGRRRKPVAMDTYLGCIPGIQRLIDTRKMGINLKERLVVLDISIHRAFLPKRFTDSEMAKADRRYAAFFDKVVAYMNFQLGRMGKKDFIDPTKERIHFHVTVERYRYVDDEGKPLPAHQQVSFDTLLVGWYQNGEVDYKGIDD